MKRAVRIFILMVGLVGTCMVVATPMLHADGAPMAIVQSKQSLPDGKKSFDRVQAICFCAPLERFPTIEG